MKHLIILLLSLNFLNASMLLDTRNTCIEDFYTQNNTFYYLQSSDSLWYSISLQIKTSASTVSEIGNVNVSTIQKNFIYDSINDKCTPNTAYILGLEETSYNFLLALCGLFFGGVFMFFTIQLFMSVGGRR